MTAKPLWYSKSIFITSTFSDMNAERDYLHSHVFPELEERLRKRRCHIEPIDLRWGVETFSIETEHAKELKVLKVCLDEIERSRPFMIGVIGDRYGWIPPDERISSAANEAGIKETAVGKSVTDLEITLGIFKNPEQTHRSFFYFRDPLPYEKMPPKLAAAYSDAHNPLTQNNTIKLEELKNRIQNELKSRVKFYKAQWDEKNNKVIGLESWGKQVLEDLWQELDAETSEHAKSKASNWIDNERWLLECFIEDHSKRFCGKEGLLQELKNLALFINNDDEIWGVRVGGGDGSGKSALFAALHSQIQNENILVLSHAAGISERSSDLNSMLLRWIDDLCIFLKLKNPYDQNNNTDEIEQTFHNYLQIASSKHRIIMLIDSIHELSPYNRSIYLTWLPKLLPKNTRLIAFTNNDGFDRFELRPFPKKITIPPLSRDDALEIVKLICKRYHRNIYPSAIQLLLDKKNRGLDGLFDDFAYENVLWLIIATEELNLLDADHFERLNNEFNGNSEERLYQLLNSVIREFPADVDGLFNWVLDRNEKLFGSKTSQGFVNLIALSRHGWRETDLQVLLPKLTKVSWDALKFATLRRSLRAHIVKRGSEGQWNFTHEQIRSAIEYRNLSNLTYKKKTIRLICDYLLNLPSGDPFEQLS